MSITCAFDVFFPHQLIYSLNTVHHQVLRKRVENFIINVVIIIRPTIVGWETILLLSSWTRIPWLEVWFEADQRYQMACLLANWLDFNYIDNSPFAQPPDARCMSNCLVKLSPPNLLLPSANPLLSFLNLNLHFSREHIPFPI